MQATPESWYSRKEISRRAVSRQEFEENPQWATSALAGLLNDGVIETNPAGLYRITPAKGSSIRNL
ncbi:MAG: hypothetical protein NTZ16_03500 [Verrucomicrobia bacterium]|nr:hypothetical protein [Verrucomicrobiota bacterium]